MLGGFLGVASVYGLSTTDREAATIRPRPTLLCPAQFNGQHETNVCSMQFINSGTVFFTELVFTFIYVTLVLSLIYSSAANKLICGILNGLSLFFVVSAAAPISGACINPAVGLAQVVFQHFIVKHFYNSFNDGSGTKVESGYKLLWCYIFGPLLGGILAGIWKAYDARVEVPDGVLVPNKHPYYTRHLTAVIKIKPQNFQQDE